MCTHICLCALYPRIYIKNIKIFYIYKHASNGFNQKTDTLITLRVCTRKCCIKNFTSHDRSQLIEPHRHSQLGRGGPPMGRNQAAVVEGIEEKADGVKNAWTSGDDQLMVAGYLWLVAG